MTQAPCAPTTSPPTSPAPTPRTRHPRHRPRAGARTRRGPRLRPDPAGAAPTRRPAARTAAGGPRRPHEVVRSRGRGRGHHLAQDRRLSRGLPLLLTSRACSSRRCVPPGSTSPRWWKQPNRPPRPAPPSSASSRPSAAPTSACSARWPPASRPSATKSTSRSPQPRHAHPRTGRPVGRDGVHRYNHNLETAKSHFTNVVTTHTYEERWDTLRMVREAGMEVCCGGILGMGRAWNSAPSSPPSSPPRTR